YDEKKLRTTRKLSALIDLFPCLSCFSWALLFELTDVQDVHVGVIEILTAHGPDESVVGRAAAHVYRPGWRDDSVVIGDDNVPHRVGLAHKVHDALAFLEVKVKVDLRAAVMQVGRAGVPNAAMLEYGQTQQKLRRLA